MHTDQGSHSARRDIYLESDTARVTLTLLLVVWVGWWVVRSPTPDKSAEASLDTRQERPLRAPLIELSGLARHSEDPDLYWSHNDSLGEARLFLVRASGRLLNTYYPRQTAVISNVDWESMAAASLDPYDGARVLYVADSGNNFHWRDDLVVYALREPMIKERGGRSALGDSALDDSALDDSALGDSTLGDSALGDSALGDSALGDSALGDSALGDSALEVINAYPYRFPQQRRDAPRSYDPRTGRCRDSEALFWWRGELYLIGKCVRGGPAPLWHIPRDVAHHPKRAPPERVTLKYVTLLPVRSGSHPLYERVTGAAVLKSSKQPGSSHPLTPGLSRDVLAVLTYKSVWFFTLSATTLDLQLQVTPLFSCSLISATPQPVRQAEAIEWRNPRELIIFTEGRGVHTLALDMARGSCSVDQP